MSETVQQQLGRLTPQQLSRLLMPPKFMLDAVYIRNRSRSAGTSTERWPAIESVAVAFPGRSRISGGGAPMRDTEVRRLADQLRTSQAPLLLLGESGVGKSTVLCEAVRTVLREHRRSQRRGFLGPLCSVGRDPDRSGSDSAGAGRLPPAPAGTGGCI